MGTCLGVAAFLVFFSIFVFFCPVSPDLYYGNNMFLLMFGGTTTPPSGYYKVIVWERVGGMTFLFILQIMMMLAALATFYIIYKCEERTKMKCAIACGLMSFLAFILSFNTLNMAKYDNCKLGFGPVFYSILYIIAFILYVSTIIKYCVDNANGRIYSSTSYKSSSSSYSSTVNKPTTKITEKVAQDRIEANRNLLERGIISKTEFDKRVAEIESQTQKSVPPKPASVKTTNNLNENEKIDLILKYKKMLDDGVITQEEFETKKKELLK